MIRSPTVIDLALLSLLALIWASAFTAIELAIAEVSPAWIATCRVVIGCLVLLPFAFMARERATLDLRTSKWPAS